MVVLTKSTPTRKINYLYNATGQKAAKKVTNNSTETMTDYLNGFHYENQRLMFSATSEGYVNIRATSKNAVTNVNYVYNYTDHLGNIRVSYAFRSTTGQAEIMEENHYYPFGLKHKKYGSVDKDIVCIDEDCYEVGIDVVPPQARKTYQYKYNGMEYQDELGLNVHDFHFRQYMQDLGRTTTLDPMAEMFYSISPYSFLNNNPLRYIDPTGMIGEDIIDIDLNGSIKITEQAGNDIVRLVDNVEKVSEVYDSYTYGENKSFTQDTKIERNKTELGEKQGYKVHFQDFDKANTFFEFASKSNVEFGIVDFFFSDSMTSQTTVMTNGGRGQIWMTDFIDKMFENPNTYLTYHSHSHPSKYDPETHHPAYPSGFKPDLTPGTLYGDRAQYLNLQQKYGDRIPQLFNVFVPSMPNIGVKYNGEKATRISN